MALKCLTKAQSLDRWNPLLFKAVTEFYTRLAQETEIHAAVKSTIESASLLGGKSLGEFEKEWMAQASSAEAIWIAYLVLSTRGEADKADTFLAKLNDQTPGLTFDVYFYC